MSGKRKQTEAELVAQVAEEARAEVIDLGDALDRHAEWHFKRLATAWDRAPEAAKIWFAQEKVGREFHYGVLDHAGAGEDDCNCGVCETWRKARDAMNSTAEQCSGHDRHCSCEACDRHRRAAQYFGMRDKQLAIYNACAAAIKAQAESAMDAVWELVYAADRSSHWWSRFDLNSPVAAWLPRQFGGD